MSRVIVKNIPKHADEKRVKSIFEKCGEVTDVRIIFREGVNRRFGFVGFKAEDGAESARKEFNNTFIDTSRIVVDIAKAAEDPNLPRAWSKYNKSSSSYKMLHGDEEGEDPEKAKEEEKREKKEQKKYEKKQFQMTEDKKKKFLEYLNLMKGGAPQSWNDDVRKLEEDKEAKEASKQEALEKAANEKKTKGKAKKEDSDAMEAEPEAPKAKAPAKIGKDKLSGAIKGISPNTDGLPVDEKRLFVLNLPHSINHEDFKKIFEKFGEVTEVKLPYVEDGSRNKGFGYITYFAYESAIRAYSELDQAIVLGRILRIKPAYAPKKLLYQTPQETANRDDYAEYKEHKDTPAEPLAPEEEQDWKRMTREEKSSYKKQKKFEMVKRLKDDNNWNTLFLNPNTIIAEMATRFKIKKSDILGPEGENQAVKMALAETQIINETKDWLTEQGLDIEIFTTDKRECKRSDSVILVKNIPYLTTEKELQELFGRYGVVLKTLLPPNKALAIIEFANSEYAQNAFKALAYYTFKKEPLYLEWAPYGLVKEDEETTLPNDNNVEEENADQGAKTLFIKNLNFGTTEETLRKTFEKQKLGKFTIKIVKKDQLSSGYGFIEFETSENAMNALKKLQNVIVDDHRLQLSVSQKKKEDGKEKNKKRKKNMDYENSTKIVVRNLPFEGTKKEVRDLFKSFGELKTVRLPQKMSGQHRGFAFVEFVSVEEAQNAFETLGNTHLYGRKLNLEWAKPEDSMEEMVKKVKKE